MGRALYRTYRPKRLADVVGQEHITTALSNSLKNGTISHAYLFTGPRGVGKTSIARILAHEINQLPYEDDTNHLDIIEIDAASNRRIDEIRDLRERVHTAPSQARYKVYIIDEVHMLTKEAFNALLKTLEEPPAHVVFILATTESHKLPETIISRTQRYGFRPIESVTVAGHLKQLAEKESINIDDDALELIAAHGDGSFRDSISLLDQVRSTSAHVTTSDIQQHLGIAPVAALDAVWRALAASDQAELVQTLANLRSEGYQSGQLAKQLGERFRVALLDGQHPWQPQQVIQTLAALLAVPASHDVDTALDLVLFGLVFLNQGVVVAAAAPAETKPAATPAAASTDLPTPKKSVEPAAAKSSAKPEAPVTDTPKAAPAQHRDTTELWQAMLDDIKKRHNTLYGVLRLAEPHIEGENLTLGFGFAFHQKRVSEPKNTQILLDTAKKVSGRELAIDCVITGKGNPSVPKPAPEESLSTISNIFGGGEVIE